MTPLQPCPSPQKQYTLHDRYNSDGDITLIGADNVEFKVHSYHLKAHSTVFQGMLISCDTSSTIDLPDITSRGLLIVLAAFDGRLVSVTYGQSGKKLDWADYSQALKFCQKYHCVMTGQYVLDAALSTIPKEDLFEAWVLVSVMGSNTAGWAILCRGHETYQQGSVTDAYGRRVSVRLPESPKQIRIDDFEHDDVRRVKPEWLLALAKAENALAANGTKQYQLAETWHKLSDMFMKFLKEVA